MPIQREKYFERRNNKSFEKWIQSVVLRTRKSIKCQQEPKKERRIGIFLDQQFDLQKHVFDVLSVTSVHLKYQVEKTVEIKIMEKRITAFNRILKSIGKLLIIKNRKSSDCILAY
mgnify:CR=1 FL=1